MSDKKRMMNQDEIARLAAEMFGAEKPEQLRNELLDDLVFVPVVAPAGYRKRPGAIEGDRK